MSITLGQFLLYCGTLFILWLTPGPVWLAALARGMVGGLRGVVPLAFGVALGDIMWCLLAILGLGAINEFYDNALTVVRYFGVGVFVVMGFLLIRHADKMIDENSALARPGIWAGFFAGVAAVTANPKAILFYLGLLPSLFDLNRLQVLDIVVICLASALVPFLGNMLLGQSIGFMRGFLRSPKALWCTNITAGVGMIIVGILIGFS